MSAATYSESEEIACPHCGVVERDLNDYSWNGAQDTISTHCEKCKGEFRLERVRTVIYRAFPVTP